jgi:hypothetical protein
MLRKTSSGFVLLALLSVSACGPSGGEHGGHGGHGILGLHHIAAPLMHHAMRMGLRGATRQRGFRRACEDDAAKLCPSLSRRQQRDCLQGKRTMLSTECREALDRRLERGNRRNNEHAN